MSGLIGLRWRARLLVASLLLLILRDANRSARAQTLLVSKPSTRYANSTFDQGEQVALAVQALSRLSIDPKSLELLATRQAFETKTRALAEALVGQPCELQFPDNAMDIVFMPVRSRRYWPSSVTRVPVVWPRHSTSLFSPTLPRPLSATWRCTVFYFGFPFTMRTSEKRASRCWHGNRSPIRSMISSHEI